jgi:hypothetical protein
MSRSYGSSVIPVAVFLAILLIVLPAGAANATTETTTVIPTTNVTATDTTTVIPTTNVTVTATTNVTPSTTVVTSKTTPASTKTTVTVAQPTTTVPTANPTTPVPTTGSVKIFSSPAGASILIDGVYVGTTPGTINGVPAGTHILRLALSGYYDYEGSIYIVPGEVVQGYGTLQPMSRVTATPTAVPTVIVPVIVTVTPEATEETGLLGNSTVLAAILGVITAVIAAGASVFTHLKPPKKD